MTRLNVFRRRFALAGLTAAALGALGWGLGANLRPWLETTSVAAQGFPPAPWTAVGSSGSVDELSLPYFGFTNASAGYKPTASLAPLEFRYNVVNVQHYLSAAGGIPTVTMPGWTTLEFGAQAPGTSVAEAYLYRVNRCTGQQVLICQVRHYNQPAPGICRVCQFPNTTFNFTSYLYYVRVVLDRNTVNENPMAHTLRMY